MASVSPLDVVPRETVDAFQAKPINRYLPTNQGEYVKKDQGKNDNLLLAISK
jgi:hypothetical protein